MFFENFQLTEVEIPGGHIRLRHGGSGPPLLLLHGNPQSHAMWNLVAPELATRFHVICADLRGYGGSHKPGPTADHAPDAKRGLSIRPLKWQPSLAPPQAANIRPCAVRS